MDIIIYILLFAIAVIAFSTVIAIKQEKEDSKLQKERYKLSKPETLIIDHNEYKEPYIIIKKDNKYFDNTEFTYERKANIDQKIKNINEKEYVIFEQKAPLLEALMTLSKCYAQDVRVTFDNEFVTPQIVKDLTFNICGNDLSKQDLIKVIKNEFSKYSEVPSNLNFTSIQLNIEKPKLSKTEDSIKINFTSNLDTTVLSIILNIKPNEYEKFYETE